MSYFLQKKWLVIFGICFSLIVIFSYFYFKKSTTSKPTVIVTKGSIIEQAEAVGYIKARHLITIKSQVDGMVEAIYHYEGEYVKKDTPLIKIKPAPAPEVYAEAYQNLATAKTKEKEAKLIFERQQKLLKDRIITPKHFEYTTAQNNYDVARNNKILAGQKLSLLEHGGTIVGGKQIESVVTSPIDGHILYRGIDIGDPIISISSAQSATSLFTIADMQELMFQGVVDERDAAKIKVGMSAKIKIGSLPDQEITGTISRIALQSDKESLSVGSSSSSSSSGSSENSPFNVGFKIEITDLKIPKDLMLRSGYSATASISIKKVDNVLMLPLRVIQFKGNKPYVLLYNKKKKEPKQQSVELGISDNINAEIKSGLKLGDSAIDQPDQTIVTQN